MRQNRLRAGSDGGPMLGFKNGISNHSSRTLSSREKYNLAVGTLKSFSIYC